MREWVERTVERILSLRPRRVLEIGCGTGLLLFRIAPRTDLYLGTDFSSIALDGIRRQLDASRELPQVELRQAMAHEVADVAPSRRSRSGRPQLGRPVLPGRRLPGAGAGGGGAGRRAGRRGLPRRSAEPPPAAGSPHLGRAVPGRGRDAGCRAAAPDRPAAGERGGAGGGSAALPRPGPPPARRPRGRDPGQAGDRAQRADPLPVRRGAEGGRGRRDAGGSPPRRAGPRSDAGRDRASPGRRARRAGAHRSRQRAARHRGRGPRPPRRGRGGSRHHRRAAPGDREAARLPGSIPRLSGRSATATATTSS